MGLPLVLLEPLAVLFTIASDRLRNIAHGSSAVEFLFLPVLYFVPPSRESMWEEKNRQVDVPHNSTLISPSIQVSRKEKGLIGEFNERPYRLKFLVSRGLAQIENRRGKGEAIGRHSPFIFSFGPHAFRWS